MCLKRARRRRSGGDAILEHKPLFEAVTNADISRIRGLIVSGKIPVGAHRDATSNVTALHEAAVLGDEDVCNELLNHGADVNYPDAKGMTPLVYAALSGNFAFARRLLDAGAHPDGSAADAVAAASSSSDADPKSPDGTRRHVMSPCAAAAWRGHMDIVQLLLNRGENPTVGSDSMGKRSWELAEEWSHHEVAEMLKLRPDVQLALKNEIPSHVVVEMPSS